MITVNGVKYRVIDDLGWVEEEKEFVKIAAKGWSVFALSRSKGRPIVWRIAKNKPGHYYLNYDNYDTRKVRSIK